MAENISKIILNGTEYALKDNVTQYHTINGQQITGGTGDITITGGSGLKKWEGTRAEYNALSSYDADTLYIITDEDVEIPVVPTKVSAFENDAGYLTQHQDISNLATKDELNNKQDKGDYALKTDIPVVPTKVSAFENDAGYLTQHQDISNLATKTELNNKQDKGDYALKTDIPVVPTKVSAFENDKGYLTEHQDLSSYALKTELPVVPTKVSAFENDAGYALKSNSEEITFTLEDGSTVTKKFILG